MLGTKLRQLDLPEIWLEVELDVGPVAGPGALLDPQLGGEPLAQPLPVGERLIEPCAAPGKVLSLVQGLLGGSLGAEPTLLNLAAFAVRGGLEFERISPAGAVLLDRWHAGHGEPGSRSCVASA